MYFPAAITMKSDVTVLLCDWSREQIVESAHVYCMTSRTFSDNAEPTVSTFTPFTLFLLPLSYLPLNLIQSLLCVPGLQLCLFPFISLPIHNAAHAAGSHHYHWAPLSNKWLRTTRTLRRPAAEHSARICYSAGAHSLWHINRKVRNLKMFSEWKSSQRSSCKFLLYL